MATTLGCGSDPASPVEGGGDLDGTDIGAPDDVPADSEPSPDAHDDTAADVAPDASPLTDAPFTTDRVLPITLELAAADWEALRHQRRSPVEMFGGDCQAKPHVSPYTWFPAAATVDGVPLAQVDVRKKGWIGSVNPVRPSLKVKLDRFAKGQALGGYEDLILNSAVQDPTRLKQCLGYALFAAAGLPSPACGLAHVTVNGEDLGVYVAVEAVDGDFLERRFGDRDVAMWEGVFSDFRDGWLGSFEPETDVSADTAPLAALAEALAAPDDTLVASLEDVLDLDAFLSFWAVESLLRHHDGYADNANNFHVLRHPDTGLLVFVPHGLDAILDPAEATAGPATSAYFSAALTRRLWDLPATRARYVERLEAILDEHWDAAALGAEIDRLEDLLAPLMTPPEGASDTWTWPGTLAPLRTFVSGRRAQIEAELAAPLPDAGALLASPCKPVLGTFTGTFEATLSPFLGPPAAPGTGTFAATVGDETPTVTDVTSRALLLNPNRVIVRISATAPDGPWKLEAELDASRLVPGTSALELVTDLVRLYRPGTGGGSVEVGRLGPGTLILEAASLELGAVVRGSVTGSVSAW